MYKVCTIVGTRPEIIKLSSTIKKIDKYFKQVLVHTGQNYDYELDKDLISNNITIIQRKLSEIELKYLMNSHMFHFSPSCFEGFGHTICEGLSCGSVVITTNNGPMNEIIDSKIFIPTKQKYLMKNLTSQNQ